MATQLLVAVILFSTLGAAGLGVYLIASSLSRIAQILLESGQPELLATAEVADLGTPLHNTIAALLNSLKFAAPLLLVAGVGIFVPSLSSTAVLVAAGTWLALARSVCKLVAEIMRSRKDHFRASFFDGTADLVAILAIGGTTSFITSPLHAILVSSGGATIVAITGVAMLRSISTAQRSPWLPAMRPGIAGSRLVQHGLSYSDVPLVGLLLGPEAAATYGIATRLGLLLSLPLSLSNQLNAPHLVRALKRVEQVASIRTIKVRVRLAFGATVLIAATLVVLSSLFSGAMLKGDERSELLVVLAVIAIGQIVNSASGPCVLGLVYDDRRGALLTLSGLAIVLALGGSAILSTSTGVIGVAVSFSFATTVQNLGSWLLLRQSTGVDVSVLPSDLSNRAMAPQW